MVLQRVQIIAEPDEGELFIERVPGRHHRKPATLPSAGETRERLRRGHALGLTVNRNHLRGPVQIVNIVESVFAGFHPREDRSSLLHSSPGFRKKTRGSGRAEGTDDFWLPLCYLKFLSR